LEPEPQLTVARDVAPIVRPHAFVIESVEVREKDHALDEPLRQAAAALRTAGVSPTIADAVRAMYHRLGIDPTKTRPSSEALLRRVRKGDELPRVNSLVDVINWCSAESGLPFGLYDMHCIDGPVAVRLGSAGEEYPGIRKDVVHVAGRLTLADTAGPFGNPTSDSARTMITTATTAALVVIFVPMSLAADLGPRIERLVRGRVSQYASAR
jgi:DNA/RNA-binding domain of Phe-tRNA-synthetase-like protein